MTTTDARPVHPAADVFPMLDGDALRSLADDIAARGLIHPIVVTGDGTVLDGRNRLAACEIAGVAPEFRVYTDPDPVRFVMSANLERRHLSEDQRAFLALELLPILEAEAAQRMRAGTPDPGAELHKGGARRSTEAAAAAVKVKGRRVAQAKRIREQAPDLQAKVECGALSMGKAERIAADRAAGITEADAAAWYTPPWLFDQLAVEFDVDVCAPADPEHRTVPARTYWTAADDGLTRTWHGLVWCNPPYSTPEPWADRMVGHGDGLLLVHMPNNAGWMVRAQRAATAVRLIQSMEFVRPNGQLQRPGYSLALLAYGHRAGGLLRGVDGRMVGPLWEVAA